MVSSVQGMGAHATWDPPQARSNGSFLDSIRSAVAEVDAQQQDAQQRVTDLMQGKDEDVHTAMLSVERAELSFQLMMQFRNKVVAAYEEVARMQF
jgi:flagellar hook-basal body complex protein FliE